MTRDLDLRKVRYLLALAEELNYGRAARRLRIAQPVLTRQIRALETELHAQLVVRDKRRVTLTEAGESLCRDAAKLLAAATAAQRRVGMAARGTHTFTVGFMPGLIVTPAAAELERRRPDVRVEVVRTGWDDQTQVLHDGRVDVSYVRLPIDRTGLELMEIGTEARAVVVTSGHRLARRSEVTVVELAGEHLLQNPDAVPEWRAVSDEVQARVPRRPEEDHYTVEEKLEHVARGRGVAVLPLSVARSYRRPDVAVVTIGDIGPNRIGLAWEAGGARPLVGAFVDIVRTVGSPVPSE